MKISSTAPLDPEPDTLPEAAGPLPSGLPSNLRWSVLKNTAAQAVGRGLITLGRLAIISIIVRKFGKDTFGEYSLVLVLLSLAEWLLDFGVTDFFVREICREPGRRPHLLRVMTAVKLVQIPAGVAILIAALFAFRYPADIVKAGLLGGASMIFFAGVLVYRVIFKATLTLEFEVGAELASVVAMILLLRPVSNWGGGLSSIFVCYLISRGVFFGLCFLSGRSRYSLSVRGVTWNDIRWSFQSSAAIGAAGLLIVVYETLDLLLLSRVGNLSEVAYYSAAQKFVWPFLMALSAIGGTLYPIVASYWPHARAQFEDACQRGLDVGIVLTGMAMCPVLAASSFFLGLLGPTLVAGVPVLKILALICFMKAISTTLGPVLYVVHAQKHVLKVAIVAVALKAALIAAIAPRFGAVGVALSTFTAEMFSVAASVYLIQRFAGYRVRWTVLLKVVTISVAAAVVLPLLSIRGLPAAAAAVALYCPLVFLSGALRFSEVRSLLRWKTA